MMSWCGHVKTLTREWVIERMEEEAEEHQKK